MKKGAVAVVCLLVTINAAAADAPDGWNSRNCVASPWTDAAGNTISVDDKFGAGSAAVTRCLAKPVGSKIVYQLNKFCDDAACTKPYAIGNILNHIRDLEVTHGVSRRDFAMVVVIHSGAWKQVLDPAKGHPNASENVFAEQVKSLIAHPSVRVLFCQNTANSNKVQLGQMIDGVGFVTAGVSAITDLQRVGYKYVQP